MHTYGKEASVPQKDGRHYALVPNFPLGLVTADQLRKLADVADKYELQAIKFTSGARVALVGFEEDQIEAAWEDLKMVPSPAGGSRVRSIKACAGMSFCRFAKQDSIKLGSALDAQYSGMQLPDKAKFSVSGCTHNCSEASVRDIGFVGKPGGWTMLVGGTAASRPRLATELVSGLSDDEALLMTGRVVAYFQENGRKGERIGRFIDRIGFESFAGAVLPGPGADGSAR